MRAQPWFVKAMGNAIVIGALGMIAAKLLGRRHATGVALSEREGDVLFRETGRSTRGCGKPHVAAHGARDQKAAERFFGSLKGEHTALQRYAAR